MRAAMVNVEGLSDEEVVTEVRYLLGNAEELERRAATYAAGVAKHFLSDECARKLLRELETGT